MNCMKTKKLLILIPITAMLLSGCLPPKKGSGSKTSGSGDPTTATTDTGGGVPSTGTKPTSEPDIPIPEDAKEYYKDIDDNATGETLLNALNSLNSAKRKKTIGYAGFKTMFKYTEIDPKGTTPAGKMYGFYNNALVNADWDNEATWNREHVWPRSRGGNRIEGDILMTRPTSVKINSERGNMVYGSVNDSYDPGQYVAEYRGIAARIILYGAIAEKTLHIDEETGSSTNSMGILSELLKWNLQYLPGGADSDSLALRIEYNRNEVNATNPELQGNRNPFVDHPEYACRIWGTTDSATRKACGL